MGKLLTLTTIALFALLQNINQSQAADVKSTLIYKNFTETTVNNKEAYSAEYHELDQQDGYWRALITLRIKNLDYSTWSTQGQDGVWLGIGFGANVMLGTDIIMCQFLFSGIASTADKFICTDRVANEYALPTVDNQDDVDDVLTQVLFDPITKTCELAATFKRKLNTGDPNGQDYTMRDGDTFNAIWGWGNIFSNIPNGHTSSSSKRGSFRMQLSSLRSDSIYNMGMSALYSMFFVISALTLF
eukprot:403339755